MPTEAFNNFAKHCAAIVGSPWAFVCAVVIVLTWVMTGPHFTLFGHVAARDQYRYDHCDLPHSVPHPEYSKS